MPAAARHPAPPADLDGESKRLWKATIKDLADQAFWRNSDAPLLERYVRALERARDARDLIDTYGVTTEGSQGQIVVHPSVKMLRDAELDAQRYAESLLLTPRSRAAAKSGDDAPRRPAAGGKFGL